MHREVVAVPEREVPSAVAVVVDGMDTALRPGVVAVSVGPADPAHVRRRTDAHGVGEGAVAGLDEHLESGGVRHDQIVAAVPVHVSRDVDVGDFSGPRRLKVGRHRHEQLPVPRFGSSQLRRPDS